MYISFAFLCSLSYGALCQTDINDGTHLGELRTELITRSHGGGCSWSNGAWYGFAHFRILPWTDLLIPGVQSKTYAFQCGEPLYETLNSLLKDTALSTHDFAKYIHNFFDGGKA